MKEFAAAQAIGDWVSKHRRSGLRTAFVPTMGALHEGHISLIREARKRADIVVSSIFVNPTQFNDPEDFRKYPITLATDLAMLKNASCDAVFVPDTEEIYPDGTDDTPDVDLGYLGECLEAARRPGHFEGVMQVVHRLLTIVGPDLLLLGRKDHQQFLVVQAMVRTCGLDVELAECPIVREEDGLAMSSRNRRLDPDSRSAAAEISRCLSALCAEGRDVAPDHLTKKYTDRLNANRHIDVEYLEIVDDQSLRRVRDWADVRAAMVCTAAVVGGVRLIDNATIY